MTTAAPIYVVAGGNHVVILVDASETGGNFDVVEVVAAPGGGPPPHQHAFAEWFHVVEGELQLAGEHDGAIVPTVLVRTGETARVGPWEWHATRNDTQGDARFIVVGRPGLMSGYFAEAGVQVPGLHAPPDHPPAGPAELAALAERYDIRFWD